MLTTSDSARARYSYSRPLLRSLNVSASHSGPLARVVSPPPSHILLKPPRIDTSLNNEKLILPASFISPGNAVITRLSSSSPLPGPPSSPPSSASSAHGDDPCSLKLSITTSPTPVLPGTEIRERFLKWLATGRHHPLDLPCTREVYLSTTRLLEIEGLLPRMARDFDPATNTWHIRSRPHTLHELSHPIIGELKSLLQPQLARTVLRNLSHKILWHRGSDTTLLPNGGVKEPDAGIGLQNRTLPTIVVEVGYSETRTKLRLDAHRWLQTGLPDRSRVKRKRGEDGEAVSDINPSPVMLVILISFEGQRLADQADFQYSEIDVGDEQGTLKPLTVWVELWRLAPVTQERPKTRSAIVLVPTMMERKRFWPAFDPEEPDFVEIFATDIFGGDKIHDPGNATRFNVPLVLFQEVLRKQMVLAMRAQMEAGGKVVNDDDDGVIDLENKGHVPGEGGVAVAVWGDGDYTAHDREGGGEVVDEVRVASDIVHTPAEKRQKL